MQQAKEEFARGDRLQASEKAWGALAQQLKGLGLARGWYHASHDHVRGIGIQIGYERNNPQIVDLTHKGRELHTNFYENHLSAGTVFAIMSSVDSILDDLETLRTAHPLPYTVNTTDDARRIQLLTGDPVSVGDSSPTGFVKRDPSGGSEVQDMQMS